MTAPDPIRTTLDSVMRQDRGRLLASLGTSLGSFSLAEDCLQDALSTALVKWGDGNIPQNPQGWLLQVSRRKAIDILRRSKNLAEKSNTIAMLEAERIDELDTVQDIPDQRLRLIFTCCHPALSPQAQVALTLHTLGGLTTQEIARAFLIPSTTMGQRLTRAKNKIKQAGIPFVIPEASDLGGRIDAVLQVIYLIYNEGYSATQGQDQMRIDLCQEALYLARMVVELAPDQSEPAGLLALILFSHARRKSRVDTDGNYCPLDQQDRGLWDRIMIDEGKDILAAVLPKGQIGPYQLQAAIHGLHCDAEHSDGTDWPQIAGLYALLERMVPTPVVKLNYAVALSFAGKPDQAFEQVDMIGDALDEYQPFYAARADILCRLNLHQKAASDYSKAIMMTQIKAEKDFLTKRLQSCRQKLQ